MTALLAAAGLALVIVGITSMPPLTLIWIPGWAMLVAAYARHQDRHTRRARQRRNRRRGYVAP